MLNLIIDLSLIATLYISFSLDGLYEEKLYKTKYTENTSGHRHVSFSDPILKFTSTAFIAAIISGLIILFHRLRTKTNVALLKPKDRVIIGALYMGAKYANESSIPYLDFITKTIGKSCKSFASNQ